MQWQQVQTLITKELGSGAAASKLEHVESVAMLRALDPSSMQQLGLGIGMHAPSLPPQTSHLMQLCYARDFYQNTDHHDGHTVRKIHCSLF